MDADPNRVLALRSSNAIEHQADDLQLTAIDDELVRRWLRSYLSDHTRDAYARDVARFRAFVQKPLAAVGIDELQDFADSLTGQPTSRARQLAAVKSLLGHGHRTGVLPLNVGAQLKLPR